MPWNRQFYLFLSVIPFILCYFFLLDLFCVRSFLFIRMEQQVIEINSRKKCVHPLHMIHCRYESYAKKQKKLKLTSSCVFWLSVCVILISKSQLGFYVPESACAIWTIEGSWLFWVRYQKVWIASLMLMVVMFFLRLLLFCIQATMELTNPLQ